MHVQEAQQYLDVSECYNEEYNYMRTLKSTNRPHSCNLLAAIHHLASVNPYWNWNFKGNKLSSPYSYFVIFMVLVSTIYTIEHVYTVSCAHAGLRLTE